MFNKPSTEQAAPKEAETIIGPSVKVKGNFHGEGNMIIEGEVEGSVRTKGSLYIGDKARIAANIEAKEARVGGRITGNIKIAGYLNISAQAQITGDIEAATISIERGARLNGRLLMADGGGTKDKEPA